MRLTEKTDEDFLTIKAISDASFSGGERPPEAALRYNFDNGEVFVRKFSRPVGSGGGRIVGFAIVTRASGGGAYLWSIATLSTHREVGIAGELIAEIIDHCEDTHEKDITLTVSVDNPAQKLYYDCGFRAVRVTQHFYGETSGLKMRRVL